MMKRRPRGKLSRLPIEYRVAVIDLLLNGATYAAVRERLREMGLPAAAIPTGDAGFQSFMAGDEFIQAKAARLQGLGAAAAKKVFFDGLQAGGGLPPAIEAAMFQMQESLEKALSTGAIEAEDLPKVANALSRLGSVAVAFERLRQTRLAVIPGETEAAAALDPAAVADELDRLLGVTR